MLIATISYSSYNNFSIPNTWVTNYGVDINKIVYVGFGADTYIKETGGTGVNPYVQYTNTGGLGSFSDQRSYAFDLPNEFEFDDQENIMDTEFVTDNKIQERMLSWYAKGTANWNSPSFKDIGGGYKTLTSLDGSVCKYALKRSTICESDVEHMRHCRLNDQFFMIDDTGLPNPCDNAGEVVE